MKRFIFIEIDDFEDNQSLQERVAAILEAHARYLKENNAVKRCLNLKKLSDKDYCILMKDKRERKSMPIIEGFVIIFPWFAWRFEVSLN